MSKQSPLGKLAQTMFEGQMEEASRIPRSKKEELLEDLIKTNILELVQRVSIRPRVGDLVLTPYQQTVADLAAKYKVPSPYDE
jgi:hypothetical protein